MSNTLIYRRVSTVDKQDVERQLAPIESFCKRKQLNIVGDYYDKLSGTVPLLKRKGYKLLLQHIECYS